MEFGPDIEERLSEAGVSGYPIKQILVTPGGSLRYLWFDDGVANTILTFDHPTDDQPGLPLAVFFIGGNNGIATMLVHEEGDFERADIIPFPGTLH